MPEVGYLYIPIALYVLYILALDIAYIKRQFLKRKTTKEETLSLQEAEDDPENLPWEVMLDHLGESIVVAKTKPNTYSIMAYGFPDEESERIAQDHNASLKEKT